MIWQIDPRKRSRSSLIAIEVFGASNCFFAVSCHFEWSQSGWDKVCLKFCVWYGSFSSRYGLRQEDMILKTFIVGPGVKLRRHNFQGRGIWCLFVKKFYAFRSFWNLETSLFQYLYYSWRRYSDSLFEAMLGSSLLLLGKLPAGKYKSNRIENKKMKIAQKKQMLEDQETASIKVKEA